MNVGGGDGGFCAGPGMPMQPGFSSSFGNGDCVIWLFRGLVLDTAGKYAGGVIGTFLVAVLNEGLRWLRNRATLDKQPFAGLAGKPSQSREGVYAALYVVQMAVAYSLMLIFMTYDWILCAMVLLGLGTGMYIFSIIDSPPPQHKVVMEDYRHKPSWAPASPDGPFGTGASKHNNLKGGASRRTSATPASDLAA